jgi:hypothetical protein
MEVKFAAMRATLNGRDNLFIFQVNISEGKTLAYARRAALAYIRQTFNISPTWVGWVDEYSLAPTFNI